MAAAPRKPAAMMVDFFGHFDLVLFDEHGSATDRPCSTVAESRSSVIGAIRRAGRQRARRRQPGYQAAAAFAPREFSGVQFHEVEHACRRLAGEFDEVIRHAVIPPLHVKFRHRRQVVDEVRWHPNSRRLSVHAESGTLR